LSLLAAAATGSESLLCQITMRKHLFLASLTENYFCLIFSLPSWVYIIADRKSYQNVELDVYFYELLLCFSLAAVAGAAFDCLTVKIGQIDLNTFTFSLRSLLSRQSRQ